MNYKFYKEEIDGIITLGIMPEKEEYNILFRFGSYDWTSLRAQEIIDGVEESRERPKGEEYIWANEDVTLYSNENGILFIDDISQRVGENDPEKLNFGMSTDEFIVFMQEFKLFIEENS